MATRIRGGIPPHAEVHPEPLTDMPEVGPPAPVPAPGWPELTAEEIDQVKLRNPGFPVYRVAFGDQVYVIRPVTSREWLAIVRQIIAEDAKTPVETTRQDELICQAGVIWPVIPEEARQDFWARNLAGAARSLVIQIRAKSGFSTIAEDGTVLAENLSVTELLPEPLTSALAEPDETTIAEMKAASPNRRVYRAETPDGIHYFRPWTRIDYEDIQANEERGDDFRDVGVRKSLLWSTLDWSARPSLAGLVEVLFEAIFVASGFTLQPEITQL